MLSEKKLKNILEQELQKNSNIIFGYLFGSYADGSYNDRSDIDIALYLVDNSFDAQLSISFELSRTLKKNIDLTVLNTIKNLYLSEDILNKGIVIKDSDKRIDFELKKHHQFIDFIEFKKRIYVA